jgi:hypothetical protein
MPKAFDSWKVLSHGALRELSDNVWHVSGALPGMSLERHMTVIRRGDGGLIIHNAIALDEDGMKKLEGLGQPKLIVVPNGYHRLDAPNFKRRYPDAKVICPAGVRAKVEQVVPVDLTYDKYSEDGDVSFEHLDGVAEREGVVSVKSAQGGTLVFNDVLFNVPRLPGVEGAVMRVLGSTGGPKVTRIFRLFVMKDRAALREHLLRLAKRNVRRIVPGHGEVISEAAAETLEQVARRL